MDFIIDAVPVLEAFGGQLEALEEEVAGTPRVQKNAGVSNCH